MTNKTLYLFVDDFSSNKKEEFFEKELPYLCANFEKVLLFSLIQQPAEKLNFVAANLQIVSFNFFQPCNRIKVFLKNCISIFRVFAFEFFHTHNKLFYIKNFKRLFNQLVLQFSAASHLESVIKNDTNTQTVFYTYWFKQWTGALSIIKRNNSQLKIVTRIHGADYDEGQIHSVIPFRYFQLKMINCIFPVSDYGRNYLINKFKVNSNKIITSRLGLNLKAEIATINSQELVIVSCSSLIKLKRVHLIIEILEQIKITCKWVHFGDGELLEDIKHKASKLKHQVELRGHVPNTDFTNYLKNQPISFFMNVSESEGIPVTMMEAIAHGIPLIGTAICGVPEIITAQTGFLFPVNFNPSVIAKKIEEEHQAKEIYNGYFRTGIVNFYKEFFFDQKNYSKLAKQLTNV